MASEGILNRYYNIGRYNSPERIGYMMSMIRDLCPITEDEWRIWYLENVHNEDYIRDLAKSMANSIPPSQYVSEEKCFEYICDVMFRRTFNGYNREKSALKILREKVSQDIKEAPKAWDTEYFIDFYVRGRGNHLIGIQLKPETFYRGHYQDVVDIEGKMEAFCNTYNAKAYVLIYKHSSDEYNEIEFINPNIISDIINQL